MWGAPFVSGEQIEEGEQRLGERLCLLVPIYYDEQRAVDKVPEQDGVERLGGGRET